MSSSATAARQVAQESQDNVLTASALSILDSARLSGGEISIDLPYAALSMLDSLSHERVFYAIRLETQFLSGHAKLPTATADDSSAPAYLSTTFLGEDVRLATVRRRVAADQIRVASRPQRSASGRSPCALGNGAAGGLAQFIYATFAAIADAV